MEEKFIAAFKEALEIEDREPMLNDKFRDYPEWNSLAQLSLIVKLDEEFAVSIESAQFKELQTIQQLFDTVQSKM